MSSSQYQQHQTKSRGYIMLPSNLLVLFIIIILNNSITFTSAQSEDYFCGLSWSHAADECRHACPTGEDTECVGLAGSEDYGCFFFTGCWDRIQNGEITKPPMVGPVTPPGGEQTPTQSPVVEVQFPTIPPTFGYTMAIRDMTAELIFTLDGVTNTMSDADQILFLDTLRDNLGVELEESGITIDTILITNQLLGFSFDYVDLTISINAKYQPLPNSDGQASIYKIAKEYINSPVGSRVVIAKLKMAGLQTQSSYFDKASGLSVEGGSDSIEGTSEPTGSPVGTPTAMPTEPPPTARPQVATPEPTLRPSESPALRPTASPSEPPTLGYQQSLLTTPLNFDGLTAKSFGYVFNVRTTATTEGPVLINGLDFYTITPGVINYELWSKLGSFIGSKGKYDEWEMISSGSITGSSGPGGITPIPQEEFTPVEIPGGGEDNGGLRAFYLTLNTNDLIYRKIDTANEEEPRYTEEADKRLHDENFELEIWEGEAVLNYPFPDPVKQAYFYRSPMEFVGALHYDRKADRTPPPTVPKVAEPTGSPSNVPTTGKPTKTPSYSPTVPDGEDAITPPSSPSSGGFASTPDTPTSPSSGGFGAGFVLVGDEEDGEEEDGVTSSPAGEVTLSPTITAAPTLPSSPTVNPDSIAAPNVSKEDLIKANIVMTLRYGNGKPPDRLMFVPEVEAFLFALTTFFNDRTTDTMVLEGIGLFMQEFVLVDKVPKKDDNVDEDATAVAEQALAKRQRHRYEQEVPKVNAMQLTAVLRVMETSLPQEVLGDLAAVTIRENQGDLVSMLKNLSGPYPYFAGIASVEAYAIDKLVRNTPPPAAADVAQIAEADGDASGDGGGGSNAGMISGIIVGLFLVAGVAAGFAYQRKRKARINEIKEDDLEQGSNVKEENGDMRSRIMNIMRNGKATLLNKSDSTNNSSRSIPNGSDSPGSEGADESNQSDESNRSSARKRKGRGKKGVSKSLTGGEANSDLLNITSKMNHSDVTTDKERKQVKDILEQDLDASDRSRSPSRKKSKKELKKDKKRERKEKRKAKERASMEQEEAAAMAAEAQQLEEMEMMDMEMREAQQLELQETGARALSAVRNSQENLLNAGGPLKNSMTRPTSQDNLKRSMRRQPSRNSLRNSNTSSASGNNNLRKSLVDKEFEAALAEHDWEFGLDDSTSSDNKAHSRPRGKRGDQRGSLRKSATQRNVNGRGSLRKASSQRNVTSADDFAHSDTMLNSSQPKKKTRRPKNGFSQSMVITSGNNGFDLGLDLDDDLGGGKKLRRSLNEDDKKLRQSQTKKKGNANLDLWKQSVNKAMDDNKKGNANLDLWKQSVKKDVDMRRSGRKVDGLDSTDDIAKAFGKPKRQGKRGDRPLNESVNKKDGDNARRRPKGDVANRASLRKSTTRNSNEDFARSDTEVLRGSGNKGSKRPGLTRTSSDRQVTSRPRGNGERASLQRAQSVRKSGTLRDSGNSGIGLRKSDTKGSSDDLRRSGNDNARKRGSERQSPRNSQTNSGGDQKLARQARANDRRRLSQSMTVSRTSELAGLRRSSRGDENRPRGDSFDARGNSSNLRRSTTSGRGGQPALKRSASSRRVKSGESGISDLKRSMIL